MVDHGRNGWKADIQHSTDYGHGRSRSLLIPSFPFSTRTRPAQRQQNEWAKFGPKRRDLDRSSRVLVGIHRTRFRIPLCQPPAFSRVSGSVALPERYGAISVPCVAELVLPAPHTQATLSPVVHPGIFLSPIRPVAGLIPSSRPNDEAAGRVGAVFETLRPALVVEHAVPFGAASVTEVEEYWNGRAVAETRAALTCDDPRIAALHVDLATRCVRKIIEERERRQS